MQKVTKSMYYNTSIFINEPFTEREAWNWLLENVSSEYKLSIRSLAKTWQWSEAKARRFIHKLSTNALIDARSDALGTTITICNYVFIKDKNKLCSTGSDAPIDAASIISAKIYQIDAHNDAVSDAGITQGTEGLQPKSIAPNDASNDAVKTLEILKKKTKKEKNQKKEKKEYTEKEKNTPYRGLKKEKDKYQIKASPAGSKLSIRQIKFQEVTIEMVLEWANANMPSTINLEWELGKFKDYWLSTSKKPPKDGLAALRNWLRNAKDYQQQKGTSNGKYQANKPERSAGLHNFLKAGASLADKYERDRLDREAIWQEQPLQPEDP